jgi:hypothetical protein
MPHTAPDWSWMGKVSTIFSLQDMAELAVRLGSIVSHDRRGNVIWMDGFENGLRAWYSSLSGTGASASLAVADARNGAYSCKLVGGSTSSRYASILKYLTWTSTTKLGFEMSFNHDSNLWKILFAILVWDGEDNYQAKITYDHTNTKVVYRDSSNVDQDVVTDLELADSSELYHNVKFVIDLSTGEYVWVRVNPDTYTLTGLDTFSLTSAATKKLQLQIQVYSNAGTNTTVYVDDVIFTQNEL